ncbi:MAG TPA: class I SAM-dependent methyltransferase [Candidatus Limnocylindrales bacterium]|nr:class I SAM-dependent methyltransferase [Candidatus Limnocylindrales bacterium]
MADPDRTLYSDSLGTEIYDLQSAAIAPERPSGGDVAFFRRLAETAGGPVLEIGSGTGRVAIQLAEAGFDVVGIDRSTAMLRVAEGRRASLAPEVAGRLTFLVGDMTALDLGRPFGLIVAPSRVFQFALTSEAQRAALRAMKAHLRVDGRLVLDLFDPAFEYIGPDAIFPARSGEVVHPRTGNVVVWEILGRPPDPAAQLVVSDWTARELGPSGEVLREETERLTLRWSTRSEMRLLFELEGLEVDAEYGDFDGGPSEYGKEQVWVLGHAA